MKRHDDIARQRRIEFTRYLIASIIVTVFIGVIA